MSTDLWDPAALSLWRLGRAMANPMAADPCPYCNGLDALDHDDDCPVEVRRRARQAKQQEGGSDAR